MVCAGQTVMILYHQVLLEHQRSTEPNTLKQTNIQLVKLLPLIEKLRTSDDLFISR